MNKKLNITQMVPRLHKVRAKDGFVTLLGIGPMSPMLLQGTLELAKEQDFPIMFIASRNQVDAECFDRGYVSNWDQNDFCSAIDAMAKKVDFDGLYYVCRDHGGPWQRDEERKAELPEDEAMALGLKSYFADIDAGFDLLHIDPTKDPHTVGAVVPMEIVLRRTVELIEKCEAYRAEKNLPPLGYEVGTEETNGGLTGTVEFETFIEQLMTMLDEKGLPHPQFIVGQTGTLTRLTENIGKYSFENARKLGRVTAQNAMELKEHNGDYLPDDILLMHPALGVGSSNVAPEYGVMETRAYLELARLEKKMKEIGVIDEVSKVEQVLSRAAVEAGRWRKWMVGETAKLSVEEVLADEKLTKQITDISGHYVFDTPVVAAELKSMLDRLEKANVPARRYVIDKIKHRISEYVTCYNLRGLTSKLMAEV